MLHQLTAALTTAGLDVRLNVFGGPGYPAVPYGEFPDGRGWILTDDDGGLGDTAVSGEGTMFPEVLCLTVYESAAENASRWPDGNGLAYNDPVGALECAAAEAVTVLCAAAAGDYSAFPDQIGPAPLVEDITVSNGKPMFDQGTRDYLRAVRLAPPSAVQPWVTGTCPECDTEITSSGLVITKYGTAAHVVIRGSVVLGCGGYFVIDPAAVGITMDWNDWRPLSHFFHCWRFPAHHACAVTLIERQAAENDTLISQKAAAEQDLRALRGDPLTRQMDGSWITRLAQAAAKLWASTPCDPAGVLSGSDKEALDLAAQLWRTGSGS